MGEHCGCDLDSPLCYHECLQRSFLASSGDASDEVDCAFTQLLVHSGNVYDHEIAVCLSQLDHGGGGQNVEHALLRFRTSLEPSRSREDFRADGNLDGNIDQGAQLGAVVVGNANSRGSGPLCGLDRTQNVGRAPRRCDADDDVTIW